MLLIITPVFITLLIIGVVLMAKSNREESELKNWYANQLRYNFSTRIDTVVHLNQKWGYGEVFLSINHTALNLYREDSLNKTLKYPIRFLRKDYYKKIKFVIPNSQEYEKGDSVYIDSRTQQISIYRDKTLISTVRISRALTDNWF